MLTIPDVRQRDHYSCGAACSAALLSYYHLPVPRWLRRLANPERGMQPDTLYAILSDAFGRPPLAGSVELHDLRHLTATGRPVICPVFWDSGHWVVVSGVTRSRVHLHCPIDGPTSVPIRDWLADWRDEPADSPYQRYALCGWPARDID
jgi:ABC-type bacteriocin/lantibiotic exporter with double-glycine peptidase domain